MSVYAGMTRDQLVAALASAQVALVQLQTGSKIATAAYAQGDGSKSVSYSRAEIGTLRAVILELQQALGIACPRRAIRPVFL